MSPMLTLPRLLTSFVVFVFFAFGLVVTAHADAVPWTLASEDPALMSSFAQPNNPAVFVGRTAETELTRGATRNMEFSSSLSLVTVPSSGLKNSSADSVVISSIDDSECESDDLSIADDSECEPVTVPSPPGAAVPEPASLLLLGTGLAGVATGIRRRMKSRQ